jgi:oleate hydratase
MEFHQEFFWNDKARLVAEGAIVDVADLGFSETGSAGPRRTLRDAGERCLERRRSSSGSSRTSSRAISGSSGARPLRSSPGTARWSSSATACASPTCSRPSTPWPGIYRTQFNQYDAMVRPIVRWLSERGVSARDERGGDRHRRGDRRRARRRATRLHCSRGGESTRLAAGVPNDLVFVTNGSMTADTSYGSNTAALRSCGPRSPAARGSSGRSSPPRPLNLVIRPRSVPTSPNRNGSRSRPPRGTRPSLICWRPSRAARRARAVSSPSRTRTGFSPSS